jgi:hypothetical protein
LSLQTPKPKAAKMLQSLASIIALSTLILPSSVASNAFPPGITAAPGPATSYPPGSSPSYSLVTTIPCTKPPILTCPPYACSPGYTVTVTYIPSISACVCAGCGPTGVWHNVPAPTNTCTCPGLNCDGLGKVLCPDSMSLVYTTTTSSRCTVAGCFDPPAPTLAL